MSLELFFPKLKFVAENCLFDQLGCIEKEIGEAQDAYLSDPIERVAEEIADVATASITALYIIERDYGIHPIDVMNRVIEKNVSRGYSL